MNLPAGTLDVEERLEFLAASDLFGVLPIEDLRKVVHCVEERRFPVGALMIAQGDPGDSLYVFLEGGAKITFISEDGREVVLNELGPGDVIGEMALIDGAPRSANCWAQGPTRALVLGRSEFNKLIKQTMLSHALNRFLCARLRQTLDFAESVSVCNLEARLARLVLHLAARDGVANGKGILIDRKIRQEDLASRINASRPKVNVQLRTWTKDGFVAFDKGVIRIFDSKALESIAQRPLVLG
jgi:CRP-like cAMP-binding protein